MKKIKIQLLADQAAGESPHPDLYHCLLPMSYEFEGNTSIQYIIGYNMLSLDNVSLNCNEMMDSEY